MCSSTFNSKDTWKVAVAVLAVLLSIELMMRIERTSLSKDLVHIEQIPASVAKLSKSEGVRTLILGNSLSREGIDLELFNRKMSGGNHVHAVQVYPDDTSILEWLHVYLHFIVKPKNEVDLVILCFAENQLQDGAMLHVRRFAQHFTDWQSAIGLFQSENFRFDQIVEFTLAKYSMMFANAERVRGRILDWVIPYYRTSANLINDVGKYTESTLPKQVPTYAHLKELIDLVHASGGADGSSRLSCGKRVSP